MRLTPTTFLTLDGMMQAPGGARRGSQRRVPARRLAVPYADADRGQAVVGWFAAADAFVLGRRTANGTEPAALLVAGG
jgi:hypothetical protein